jgi:glutathione synthase/RimK-type ligase-like ATP-grasp enzyme
MKLAIIGSGYVGLERRITGGYETSALRKAFQFRGHDVVLIDPTKTTFGVIDNECFARATVRETIHDASDFDAILVRRTFLKADEIIDFCMFAQKSNPNLFVADSVETLARAPSKADSIARRAGYSWQQDTQFIGNIGDLDPRLEFPLVSKPMFGTQGRGVRLCETREELAEELVADYKTDKGYTTLVQRDVTGDREYRVVVVDGKALGVCTKPPPISGRGFARNSGYVSEFNTYDGSNRRTVLKLAESVSLLMGLYFSGIDIIEKDGELTVLECNRNPQFKKFDFALGIRTADYVADAIEKSVNATCLNQR